MLIAVLSFLAMAAIGLLVLLFWLLRPGPTAAVPGQPAGYPIDVQTTIYGSGEDPSERIVTPLGVAFDADGNVWVADTGQSRVEEYTADGGFVRQIGDVEGPGKLSAPYGMAIDDERDRVYVADYGTHFVQVYDTDGTYVGHFPSDSQDAAVFGADGFSPYAIQLLDGRVVVSSSDGLYFLDTDGNVVGRWGGTYARQNIRGPAIGMFNFPDSFVADPATGRVYVADTMNRRIVALGRNGQWLWVSGTPDREGEIKGFWELPRGIVLGTDGNLYVIDTFRYDRQGMGVGHVVVLSPDGELLSEFGRAGGEDGSFSFPDQLATDGDGLFAVADRENNRVVLFRLRQPYPPPSDLERPKYRGQLLQPVDVWATTSPTP
jgi:DNA-binding beta-propeller fold protein YncE